jgi:benzoyl-CoA reductase/2-hydroxyglutaryl-CoA dehydratase subunit BcrC/BadD/HgdB
MKLGNDFIKKKFDDIDGKIDFMIEFCHTLQLENKELLLKITGLEAELDKKNETEEQFSEQEALIQSKIDGLLEKLNYFSNSTPVDNQSTL